MAGYRLAPRAARARRRPVHRRRPFCQGFTPTPATITGSSTANATGSLSLTAAPQLPFNASTATATASFVLDVTSAVGSRAAPGWLGFFVTDTTGSPVPLIAGGSNAVATGSLSLQVPSPALITGTSTATATGTLSLRSSTETRIATPTSLGSTQFANSTLGSVQFGNSRVEPAVDHPVS